MKKYYILLLILLIFVLQIKMPVHAEPNSKKYESLDHKKEFTPEDVTQLTGHWKDFINYLWTAKSYILLPKKIMNREIEKAYISIFSQEIDKNPAGAYHNLFLFSFVPGNDGFLPVCSTENSLKLLFKSEKFSKTKFFGDLVKNLEENETFLVNYNSTRKKIFRNFMFWKELEIISQSQNLKLAVMNKSFKEWSGKPFVHLGYDIAFNTPKKIKEGSNLLRNLSAMGGIFEYCNFKTVPSATLAIHKNQMFIIFIDDLPAYLVFHFFPQLEKHKICLARIIPYEYNPIEHTVKIAIDYAAKIPMDEAIAEKWKKVETELKKTTLDLIDNL